MKLMLTKFAPASQPACEMHSCDDVPGAVQKSDMDD